MNERLSFFKYYFNDTFDSVTGEKYSLRGNNEMWSTILKKYKKLHTRVFSV